MNVVLSIEGLVFDYRLIESDLRTACEAFGTVMDVMLLDEELAPDVGIVEFSSVQAAEKCVAALNGTKRNIEGYSAWLKVVLMDPTVEVQLLAKAHILAEKSEPFDLQKREQFVCKYVLGAHQISSEYSMVGRIVGVGGENVKSIFRQTGAHVKVNGKVRSPDDPLHVRVSADSRTALNAGKVLTEQLISESLIDFESWCHKHYIAVPPLRVVVVQGGGERPLGRLVRFHFP